MDEALEENNLRRKIECKDKYDFLKLPNRDNINDDKTSEMGNVESYD